ncbi:MAG: DUF1223 domain-containing protein [Allorhizobium sp.]
MASTVFARLAFLCAAAVCTSATAQDSVIPRGVVELFTSQGCSSCPPADRALEQLIEQGDVVALAYHVDYWNYLGWTDTLATPENTGRQYAYAHSLGRSGVYTPQAIINGRDHLKGTDAAVLNQKMDELNEEGRGLSVPVSAVQKGDELSITIGAGAGKADVVIVYFRRKEIVDVQKGENMGKRVTYWNSVTDVQTVGMWEGSNLHLVLPAKVMGKDKNDGCAILLQTSGSKGDPAAIIGATMIVGDKSS